MLAAYLLDPPAHARALLGRATTRLVYDVFAYARTLAQPRPEPAVASTLARETHHAELARDEETRIQLSFAYSDGFGRQIQRKALTTPGPAPLRDVTGAILTVNGRPEMSATDVSPRWVASGWMVFNNKGKPVRQFEPFFTDTHRFELDVRLGVSPIMLYDPIERVIATLHPNHTWEKVVFGTWRYERWDASDTVLVADPRTDAQVGGHFRRLRDAEYLPTWYARREGGALGAIELATARKAALHAGTPGIVHLDSLGRPLLTISHNRFKYGTSPAADPPVEEFLSTRSRLDIQGNQRAMVDARDRVVVRNTFDLLGNRVHQASMEAGERRTLNDAAGKSLRTWDSRGHQGRTEYDVLRRPLRQLVQGTDAAASDPRTLGPGIVVELIQYGEGQVDDVQRNLRARVFRQHDGAGVVTLGAYDFKGDLIESTRELAADYRGLPDWTAPPPPGETFTARSTYDALGRPRTLTTPDGSLVRPTYNVASLLESISINLRGARDGGEPVWTPFLVEADYDARGQRTYVRYGNEVETRYGYDPDSFRLVRLYTRRPAAFIDDCGAATPRFRAPTQPPPDDPCGLQNLHYSHDPVGNVTHIRDAAQPTLYFDNRRVAPDGDYVYDAIGRLIEASGREHLGQTFAGDPLPPTASSYNDWTRLRLAHPGDGNAMGTYLQQYEYDAAGNFLALIHRGSDPAHPGWRRAYVYDEASLLEPGPPRSNRLTRIVLNPNSAQPEDEVYGHDAHGNMTRMPHLQVMEWDFRDRLRMTQRQAVNPNDTDGAERQGERTYYVYDAAGVRARKVTELPSGEVKDERIYLSGFEIYRRYGAAALTRETLHVMDDKRRLALVETTTEEDGLLNRLRRMLAEPASAIRYQLGNHLGSASLEVDDQAQIVSYEEHYPYGGTSYQATAGQTESPKRYRYVGKERDDETGFDYYGARYHAPWLGRWTSCDPAGITDSPNLYEFVRLNPISQADPTGLQTTVLEADFADVKARLDHIEKLVLDLERSKPPDVGISGVRIVADTPRGSYGNVQARQDAARGNYRLAEIAEAGITARTATSSTTGKRRRRSTRRSTSSTTTPWRSASASPVRPSKSHSRTHRTTCSSVGASLE